MGNNTKFGWQPAKHIIKSMGMSVDQAALQIGVQSNHLRNSLYGIIVPSDEVRAGLTKLTGRKVEELFTADALNHQDQRGSVARKQCGCVCSEHSTSR